MSDAQAHYPDATRLDLVERLPESARRTTWPTPTAGWRTRRREQTAAWSRRSGRAVRDARPRPGRAASRCARRVERAARRRRGRRRRPGGASGSSSLRRLPGPGARRAARPSIRTAPSGCCVDPMAIDPGGTHDAGRLAAEQGGRPAGLPALRGRHARSRCCGSWTSVTGEVVDGPIDRARYSPVAWLLGGEALLLRPPPRPGARAGRRGAVPPPGLAAPGRHRPRPGRHGLRRRAWTR